MTVTKDTSTTTSNRQKGEAAVKHLWRQAIADGDEEKAKTIAVVANLLAPSIKLAAGAEVSAKTADATVTVDGTEVDLTGLEDRDAEDYRAYTDQIDGTAARRAQAEAHREEDAERDAYYREHPEAAPTDWDPERGYR